MTSAADAAPQSEDPQVIIDGVLNAPNPKAAYDELSQSDRQAFDDRMLPAEEETEVVLTGMGDDNAGKTIRTGSLSEAVSTAYSGCWGGYIDGKSYSAGKVVVLYTYWQYTKVCVSRGSVQSVSVPADQRGEETKTIGWRVAKPSTSQVLNMGWEGRGISQHYFVLGVGGYDIQHPTECLQIRLNADGSHYRTSRGCNINTP